MGMGLQTYLVGIRACRRIQWGSGHADYTVGMGMQTYPVGPWDLPSGEEHVDLPRGVGGGGRVGWVSRRTLFVSFLLIHYHNRPLCAMLFAGMFTQYSTCWISL